MLLESVVEIVDVLLRQTDVMLDDGQLPPRKEKKQI